MEQSKGEPKTSWGSLVAPTEQAGHTFSVSFAANACYGSGKPWLSVVKHGVTSPPPEGHPPSEAGKEEWSGGLSVSVSGIQANKEPVFDQGRMRRGRSWGSWIGSGNSNHDDGQSLCVAFQAGPF